MTSVESWEQAVFGVKKIFSLDEFTGIRLESNKPISSGCQTSHVFMIGSEQFPPQMENSLYIFGINALYNKHMLMGNLDTARRVTTRVISEWNKKFITKFVGQIAKNASGTNLSLESEYHGKNFTSSLSLMNAPVIGFAHNHNITKLLQMGLECHLNVVQKSLLFSIGAIYNHPNYTLSTIYRNEGIININYQKKINKITMGLDLQLTFGYLIPFKGAKLSGTIDSNFRIGSVIEEKIGPTSSFSIYTGYSAISSKIQFGIGIKFS